MTYGLFEIPCESGGPVDIVWADPNATDRKAYTHWAYVIDTNDSENNVLDRRGIPFRYLRDWRTIRDKFPNILSRFNEKQEYYVGESVLKRDNLKPEHQIRTVLRLGALELLANIYSGRITASDKDPFPHQLALQQYVKDHESRLRRILIADEVGLGKTIEVGLLLRDRMIADPENFRCLYGCDPTLMKRIKSVLIR